MHGYHHVIKELTRDNQGLTERIRGLEGDLESAREEVKLMEELKADGGEDGESGEWKERAERYAVTIKEVGTQMAKGENIADKSSSKEKSRN